MFPFSRRQGNEKLWRYRDDNERDDSGAPDSERPHGTCPRCGREANFHVMGNGVYTPDFRYVIQEKGGPNRNDELERVTLLVCQGCRQTVVVLEEKCILSDKPKYGTVKWRGFFHWPPPLGNVSADVPDTIAGIYKEAVAALAANLPRAATILARATLDAITLEKGEAKSATLKKRLENLASKNILQTHLADWATEVRLIGNEGAHDPNVTIDIKDARELVNFVRELLKYLYELPADLARRRGSTP